MSVSRRIAALVLVMAIQQSSASMAAEPLGGTKTKFVQCANITDAENQDHPAPDYVHSLQGPFTLILEMTMMKKQMTHYVKEVRERRELNGEVTDSGAVYLRRNGTATTYYYYPSSDRMVEEQDGQCRETGTEVPPFNPWGWWDPDPSHGDFLYGPSALIRRAHFFKKRYLGGDRVINGVTCERWLACEAQNSIEVYYYFSQNPWAMPESPFFSEGGGRLPVQIEVLFLDESERVQYNIQSFTPYVKDSSLAETPRGESCEGLVGVAGGGAVPRVPTHYTFSQEVISNSQIDGVDFGSQSRRKFQVTYSESLSLTRLDLTPERPEDTPLHTSNRLRVIHDFNTGVQYMIDQVLGSCLRTWLPLNSFDANMNAMLGPNQIFHLDDTFAFVGQRGSRGVDADLWTSTRNDLPNPATEDFQSFPKAVLEYYFTTSREETPEGVEEVLTPLRGDVFLYNNSDPIEIIGMATANMYDFSVVRLYTEAEFTVEECFERTDDDWSFLVVSFPVAKASGLDLVMRNIDVFRDQLFSLVTRRGRLSPTRIASIEVSEGLSGEGGDSGVVVASVKLLDRAPYIFSYSHMLDEPRPLPGEDEKPFEQISSAQDCAELCSLEKGFECKSFHHCDDNICFLSPSEASEGKPVSSATNCSHWVLTTRNGSLEDLPSAQAYGEILRAIREGHFTVVITDKDEQVALAASEALHYRSPDPLAPIRGQFNLRARRTTLVFPDDIIEKVLTLDECMTLCVTWRAYRCVTIAYHFDEQQCRLSAIHGADLNTTMTAARSKTDLFDRTYLSEYRVVLGGVTLNSSGTMITNIDNPDTCARFCSNDRKTPCRSFEWCHEENLCHLHEDHFLDVADGGDYLTHTSCVHFSKREDEDFSHHPHQGLANQQHRLVASASDTRTCAKLCLTSTDQTCESYDFCSSCGVEDQEVCGEDLQGSENLCFLSTHHLGETETIVKAAPHCQHFSREYFGGQDYPSWVASKRQTTLPYTAGDMAGLAVGMLFLGAALVAAFLLAIVNSRPTSSSSSTPENYNMSFVRLRNTAEGESET